MRQLLFSLLALALISTACKKDDDNAPSGNGGGGNTTTTGNNGNGLVTGWSPLRPYTDQEVTFTGGPFNTDISQNSIMGGGSVLFDILNVSSTQIVARPGPGMTIELTGYNALFFNSGGIRDTIPVIYWKRPFNLLNMNDNLDDWFSNGPARPGDSVVFDCLSATYTGMSVNINGQDLSVPIAVDSAFYCTIAFRIPVGMGEGDDESVVTTALMTASNGDGRTDTLTINWAPTPDMEVYQLVLLGGGHAFDLSDMNDNGQVLNFLVEGRYLREGSPWTLSGPSPSNGVYGSPGYQNEASIVINPVTMQPGQYTLALSGTLIQYNFTFVP